MILNQLTVQFSRAKETHPIVTDPVTKKDYKKMTALKKPKTIVTLFLRLALAGPLLDQWNATLRV